jgi:hypothetical protein
MDSVNDAIRPPAPVLFRPEVVLIPRGGVETGAAAAAQKFARLGPAEL